MKKEPEERDPEEKDVCFAFVLLLFRFENCQTQLLVSD